MITCAMGQAMCSQFNVPPEGQKRVTDAISKLKAYSSYGQVLWFGFGVKHIVRSLCETKQGATCAALCACLRVSYSTEMSARVLSVLCDQLLPSDGLSPALPQWAALVEVCAGTLNPSKFPVMVDGFCRLAFTSPGRLYGYQATTFDALAHAIAELSNVSNGNASSITFEGGYDCGWIAAVAEWLLCLKVKVLTEDGNCLYWPDSSHTNDSAQVTIIFTTHPDNLNLAKTKGLKVVNRTFRLPCNRRAIFFHDSGDDGKELFVMGRSSWSTILEDTFGSAFNELLSPDTIGQFARIFLSDVMECDSGNPWMLSKDLRKVIHPWMGPFSSPAASRERAFFLAIADRLPELSPLLEALEQSKKSTGVESDPESSELEDFCDCGRKSPQKGRSPERRSPERRIEICLYHLSLTLIHLIRLLARIDVDETIQPASTGLLMLYGHAQTDDFDWNTDLDRTYQRIFELFTGLPTHKSLKKLEAASAVCHGGICIWLPALEDPLYDPAKQTRLRVAPGTVSFRDRLYREIVDIEDSEGSEGSEEFGLSDNTHLSPPVISCIADHGKCRVSTLIVRETFDVSQLEACIELISGKTLNASNSYMDPIGLEHPGRLPSAIRLHIRRLYGDLNMRIGRGTCEMDLGRAGSQNLPKPDLTTWGRLCPGLALILESTSPPKMSYNYPEAGEWVIMLKDASIVRLFRGDFNILYYLLSLKHRSLTTNLYWFDGCIRCLAHSFTFKNEKVEVGIDIHTITDKGCTLWSANMRGRLSED